VRVKVRVPVTLTSLEVAPVTSPIPLLTLNPVAPATLQCRVTFPLVTRVVGLAANERICGGATGTSQARKNWIELDWGTMEKFVCHRRVRRCGIQAFELSRLLRRWIWYTRPVTALRIDTCNWFEAQPNFRTGGGLDCARPTTVTKHRNKKDRVRW